MVFFALGAELVVPCYEGFRVTNECCNDVGWLGSPIIKCIFINRTTRLRLYVFIKNTVYVNYYYAIIRSPESAYRHLILKFEYIFPNKAYLRNAKLICIVKWFSGTKNSIRFIIFTRHIGPRYCCSSATSL